MGASRRLVGADSGMCQTTPKEGALRADGSLTCSLIHRSLATEMWAAEQLGVQIAVCQQRQKIAVTLRRDDADRVANHQECVGRRDRLAAIQLRSTMIHLKTLRSGHISTERDGYFAYRNPHSVDRLAVH